MLEETERWLNGQPGAGLNKGSPSSFHTASWVAIMARASKPMYWQKLSLSPVRAAIFNPVIASGADQAAGRTKK